MNTDKSSLDAPEMTFWERSLFGVKANQVHRLIPGILTASILAWVSVWLSEFIGVYLLGFDRSLISPVMLAILLGLIIASIIPIPKILMPGLSFSIDKILRLGIILLGIRLTIFDVFRLGIFGVPVVLVCILGALIITTHINNWLELPDRLGALIAIGTSICGVSAIVATSPAIDADEKETAYAISVITSFGLIATFIYPYLANTIFSGEALKVGIFLGTSVHDTSQVVGAAKVYTDLFSQTLALDVATVTKLVRNTFLVLVIPLMTFYYSQRYQQNESGFKAPGMTELLPMFVLGFISLAVFRSIGDASFNLGGKAFGVFEGGFWSSLITFITTWAEYLLIVALAGIGLKTNFRMIKGVGIKPFVVGLGAAFAVGVISYITISLIAPYTNQF